jgi:hypothetical protein
VHFYDVIFTKQIQIRTLILCQNGENWKRNKEKEMHRLKKKSIASWKKYLFIQYSDSRQVQSLFKNGSSTQCDIELPIKNIYISFIPITALWGHRVLGVQGVQNPWHWHLKLVGCQPYVPAVFTPRNILVNILRVRVEPGHMGLSDATIKTPSDTIRDRFWDFLTSSVVP